MKPIFHISQQNNLFPKKFWEEKQFVFENTIEKQKHIETQTETKQALDKVKKDVEKEKAKIVWRDGIPSLHDELQKLGDEEKNNHLTALNNWLQDEHMEKVYDYFFGKTGKIRTAGNKNIFGKDIKNDNPEKQKIIRERLLVVRYAYAGIDLPKSKKLNLEEKYGELKHKPYLEARKETFDKNKHLREGIIFKTLNGGLDEAMKSFKTASKADKWKYVASAVILAVGLYSLIKKAWGNEFGKTLVLSGAALYAANAISGIASKDKQTFLERIAIDSPNPSEVTKTIIERMKLPLGEAEQIRGMIAFNGISIAELCDNYLEAGSYGKADKKDFQRFYTNRMNRVEPGKKNRIQPKEAYEVADGYFTHMGKKYFKEASESKALNKLIKANQENKNPFNLQSKELLKYKKIPTEKSEQIVLGVLLFRENHLGHTFFDANWTEYSHETPGLPFLSATALAKDKVGEGWEAVAFGVKHVGEFWDNSKNRQMVIDTFKQYGLSLKVVIWDKGMEESWEMLEPHLKKFTDHPIESIKYAGNKVWEIILEGGKKMRVLVDKGIEKSKLLYSDVVNYWKDDAEMIVNFWKEFYEENNMSSDEIVDWWVEKGKEGWKLVVQLKNKIITFIKNSVPGVATGKVADGISEWTINLGSKIKKEVTGTVKDVVDWVKRSIGLGKLSNITTKEVAETLKTETEISEESKELITNSVNSMSISKEMRDIFEPLIPLMEDADEDIDIGNVLSAPFQNLFTGNAGPVNENQWAALVAYKQHEMLLFYQNLLVDKANKNSGRITESQVEDIENDFKKNYLREITKDKWGWAGSTLDEIREKGEGGWIVDVKATDYNEALAGLLSLGSQNEIYPSALRKLVRDFEKINFEGQNKGKYANQLKALALWKFAEMAAPIANLDDGRWFGKLEETHKEYLGYLSTELLEQVKYFEGDDLLSQTVNKPEVLEEIFRKNLSVPTFKEYEKNN